MPLNQHTIELLSPAKDIECAMAAINHGADAVYIGATDFGARKGAANSLVHIEELVSYAHLFGVKVYITLNTLLFDHELPNAIKLAWDLYHAGADALIIQDFGLLEAHLPPIAIHSSTQMDNRTPQKVRFLQEVGFEQVVLARELNLEQIAHIRKETNVVLEHFIHGALCVSYSGRCYMSQSINGRSANRGECAQPCRLPYNLINAKGDIIAANKHFLSMKDLNLTHSIESLIDAGVSSFKIEGRLKDKDYVANVTAHYRKTIDAILERRPELKRASSGKSHISFEPNPSKSFNRSFTSYFVNGRQRDIWSVNSPKSIGEPIGTATQIGENKFSIKQPHDIVNGDGLCFFDKQGRLHGVRVNRSEHGVIYANSTEHLFEGATIYRNYNHLFTSIFKKPTALRQIAISMLFEELDSQYFSLTITDEDEVKSLARSTLSIEEARNAEQATEQIKKQIAKTGNTPFEVTEVKLHIKKPWFIPTSELNRFRREAIDNHTKKRVEHYRPKDVKLPENQFPFPDKEIFKGGNVINKLAEKFYQNHGATVREYGYELQKEYDNDVVMTTKHCILHELGHCLKLSSAYAKELPLFLTNEKDLYQLKFDCKACEMLVIRKKR